MQRLYSSPNYHKWGDNSIAYNTVSSVTPCSKLGVVFCHGLVSTRNGSKALYLEKEARRVGYEYVRFDCRGHGDSSSSFTSTSMKEWLEDALKVVDNVVQQDKVILVGSSFGGWMSLHVALKRPARVAGLVLVAPAVDFTETLWKQLAVDQQELLQVGKAISLPSPYFQEGEVLVNLRFFSEAQPYLFLDRSTKDSPLARIHCPVRILHGLKDTVVLPETSDVLLKHLGSQDIQLTLVKDGDHTLSRAQDLRLLGMTVTALMQDLGQGPSSE